MAQIVPINKKYIPPEEKEPALLDEQAENLDPEKDSDQPKQEGKTEFETIREQVGMNVLDIRQQENIILGGGEVDFVAMADGVNDETFRVDILTGHNLNEVARRIGQGVRDRLSPEDQAMVEAESAKVRDLIQTDRPLNQPKDKKAEAASAESQKEKTLKDRVEELFDILRSYEHETVRIKPDSAANSRFLKTVAEVADEYFLISNHALEGIKEKLVALRADYDLRAIQGADAQVGLELRAEHDTFRVIFIKGVEKSQTVVKQVSKEEQPTAGQAKKAA
ncbi:MAG: hypothetical protein WC480_00785 [Patescibacteria group bacterium]